MQGGGDTPADAPNRGWRNAFVEIVAELESIDFMSRRRLMRESVSIWLNIEIAMQLGAAFCGPAVQNQYRVRV
jgi:hypothetical protein